MTVMTAEAVEATVCGCGQDLEGCSREHCPRCGCDITAQD